MLEFRFLASIEEKWMWIKDGRSAGTEPVMSALITPQRPSGQSQKIMLGETLRLGDKQWSISQTTFAARFLRSPLSA